MASLANQINALKNKDLTHLGILSTFSSRKFSNYSKLSLKYFVNTVAFHFEPRETAGSTKSECSRGLQPVITFRNQF